MNFHWATWSKNRHSLYKIVKVEAGSPWGKLCGYIELTNGPTPNTWEITPVEAPGVWKTCSLEEAKATLIAMVKLS